MLVWPALRDKVDIWPVLDADNVDEVLSRAMDNIGLPIRVFVEVEKDEKKKKKKNKPQKILMSVSGPAAYAPPGFLSNANAGQLPNLPNVGVVAESVASPSSTSKHIVDLNNEIRRTMDSLARLIGQLLKAVSQLSMPAAYPQQITNPVDLQASLNAQITSLLQAKAVEMGILPPAAQTVEKAVEDDDADSDDDLEGDCSESSESD